MKATRFDAGMIADSIAEMVYDFIEKRQLSVDKCIELYDEIMYILEKFDETDDTDDSEYSIVESYDYDCYDYV